MGNGVDCNVSFLNPRQPVVVFLEGPDLMVETEIPASFQVSNHLGLQGTELFFDLSFFLEVSFDGLLTRRFDPEIGEHAEGFCRGRARSSWKRNYLLSYWNHL